MALDHVPPVIARPPHLFGAALLVGLGLDALWPVAVFPDRLQAVLGGGLVLLGIAVMAVALRLFRRAGTNVPTWQPTTAIVVDGLYRFSRNPIYLALGAIHAGIGVAVDGAWVLALLVPLLMVMRFGVIAAEERYLEAKFGAEYLHYKAATPRWL